MSVWDECRQLVGEGEGQTVLDILENFLKARNEGAMSKRARPLLDDVLMLRARTLRLSEKLRRGTASQAETDVERARLDQAVLGLVDTVARMEQLKVPTISIELPKQLVDEKLMAAESHLRSTGWLAEGLRLASAVCRLAGSNALGTGFRCREDMIVTNHHVIPDREQAALFRAEFMFEENAAGSLQNPLICHLEPQRCFWTSETLDVTLVGLGKLERKDIATIPIQEGAIANVGAHVSIVQHPGGGPKQIAVTNNRIVNVYDRYVHYLTDTLPGSSGAPVFLDSWRLVAIHHAGGNVRKNSFGEVIFANEGVLASAVLSDRGFRATYEARG